MLALYRANELELSVNKYHALVVRMGEKRILQGALRKLETILEVEYAAKGAGQKRDNAHGDVRQTEGSRKKRRQ